MQPMNKQTLNALGQTVSYPNVYDASLLEPIPRALGRENKAIDGSLFFGQDRWTAYEFTWLAQDNIPKVAILSIIFSSDTSAIIESKSMKLYLGSYYNTVFSKEADLIEQIEKDLGDLTKSKVMVALQDIHDAPTFERAQTYDCLEDHLESTTNEIDTKRKHKVFTNLFRSVCPVTSQPDYATIYIDYSGKYIPHKDLLGYVLSYREKAGFHETCIEQIFCDIWHNYNCEELSVLGLFTRRGGIDINPFRTSKSEKKEPFNRHLRQ